MRKNKKIKLKTMLLAVMGVLIVPIISYAAEGDIYTSFYKANAKLLQNNNFMSSALHSLGWLITKFLVEFGNIAQKLYDTAFGFIDLTDSATVNKFVSEFKIVFIALSCLALLYLGIILIMQPQKKPNVAINICFAVLCVTCSTWLFGQMNNLAFSFKAGVDSISGNTKQMAVEIVDNNMYDVLNLYNEKGTSLTAKNATTGARINDNTIDYIDINELIDYESDALSSPENPFKYKVQTFNGKNGQATIKPVSNGFLGTSIGNEFYYRYSFRYITAWLQLGSLLIVYVTLSYKCVRVAFELVVGRLLAYLYSAELSGGEKIRKIIVFIRDSYILLAVSVICVKIYTIFTEYIGSNAKTQGLTGAVFSLFIAFAIIDGPNLVEKLLGMDAGLRSSTARMMAIGRASRAAALGAIGAGAKIGKGVSNATSSFGDKMSKSKADSDNNIGGRNAETALNESLSKNTASNSTSNANSSMDSKMSNATNNSSDNNTSSNSSSSSNSMDNFSSERFNSQSSSRNEDENFASNRSESTSTANNYEDFMNNRNGQADHTSQNPEAFMDKGLRGNTDIDDGYISERIKQTEDMSHNPSEFMNRNKDSKETEQKTAMPQRVQSSRSNMFEPNNKTEKSIDSRLEKNTTTKGEIKKNVKENNNRKHKE